MLGRIPVLALVVLSSTVASATVAREPLTSLDPRWPLAVELQRRGLLGDRLVPGGIASIPTAPAATLPTASLWRGWAARVAPADGLAATLEPRLTFIGLTTDPHRQLRPIHLDVRDGEAVDPFGRVRVALVGRARLHERVTAGVDFAFDSRGDNDPRNRTRTFRQLEASNNFDAAWLRVGFEAGAITIGRLPFRWGPERLGGLLIDDVGPAFDMIHGTLAWGPHVLQTFVGQLSSEVVDGTTNRRWLYGHRADLYFLDDRLRLGLSETALVSGPSEGITLRYLNPIPLWAAIQVEADRDPSVVVNAINALDATWLQDLGRWRLRTYGSVAVDDLQVDPEGRRDDPDQLAWSAGLDASRAAWLLGYEYRRVGTWTYLHRGDGTDHRHFSRPLGAPEGPDTDRHDLRVDWRPAAAWNLFGGVARWRRGENRLSTTENRLGRAGEPFPRGTVERRWIGRAGIAWERPGTAKAALQAAFHSIENVNNEGGVDEDVWEIRAVIDLFFPRAVLRADRPD